MEGVKELISPVPGVEMTAATVEVKKLVGDELDTYFSTLSEEKLRIVVKDANKYLISPFK